MDMQFKWLLDREQQGQYWRPGKTNLADYFTKHHPPAHHRNVREIFLTHIAEVQRLRKEQAKGRETSLAMVMTNKLHADTQLFIARNWRIEPTMDGT